jgi:psp operon transcriptional activator
MAPDTPLLGRSGAFLDMLDQVSAAAPLNRPVLVIGERGTGKELIAERLHRLSSRWDQPYVTMNCAALPETLLDAELFGTEAGAYTGANRARAGRFEEASGGTLFLDEIATLSPQAQEKLLRVIEYGELQRLGSNKVIRVDVRVIGATNEDLPGLAERGRFRADLLDRLSFDVITLPPLRARRDDIPLLASHFGRRMAAELGWVGFAGFSKAVNAELLAADWPGNVRELKNSVERAVYRWSEPDAPVGTLVLDPFASPWRPRGAPTARAETTPIAASTSTPVAVPSDFRAAVAAFERDMLDAALTAARFNQREAAQRLGLSYDQLRHALKKAGLLS